MSARVDMLAAALDYAADDWPVFPVGSNKRPLTPHGFKDATTDERVIRKWWKRWPTAGIATPTGDGIFVLDVTPSRRCRRRIR